LGAQHLVKALQNIRSSLLASKREPPRALTVVRAKVLHHRTPLNYRQAAAGDSQFAQSGVKAIPLSGWARLLLAEDIQKEAKETDKLYLALQRAGHDRTAVTVSNLLPSPAPPPCARTPTTHIHAHARAHAHLRACPR
jgi:hypothetical protein